MLSGFPSTSIDPRSAAACVAPVRGRGALRVAVVAQLPTFIPEVGPDDRGGVFHY